MAPRGAEETEFMIGSGSCKRWSIWRAVSAEDEYEDNRNNNNKKALQNKHTQNVRRDHNCNENEIFRSHCANINVYLLLPLLLPHFQLLLPNQQTNQPTTQHTTSTYLFLGIKETNWSWSCSCICQCYCYCYCCCCWCCCCCLFSVLIN